MFTTTSDADGFRKGGTVRAANGDGSINAVAGSGLCRVFRACSGLGLASFRADANDARNNKMATEASGWVVICGDNRAMVYLLFGTIFGRFFCSACLFGGLAEPADVAGAGNEPASPHPDSRRPAERKADTTNERGTLE